jgi:hypothetical protein
MREGSSSDRRTRGRSGVSRVVRVARCEDVAGRIAEGGHPKITLRIRHGYHRPTMSDDALERIVDALE